MDLCVNDHSAVTEKLQSSFVILTQQKHAMFIINNPNCFVGIQHNQSRVQAKVFSLTLKFKGSCTSDFFQAHLHTIHTYCILVEIVTVIILPVRAIHEVKASVL